VSKVITLTTDFGTRDAYVGTMKGVILRIAPEAAIVDLTHEVEKQDITEAALVLKTSHAFFPDGAIHLAVVDPGVGGTRRPIVLRAHRQLFVGPDNGIFSFLVGKGYEAWLLEAKAFRLDIVSDTFHGRDIFAPAAAHLARGTDPSAFGPAVRDLVEVTARQSVELAGAIRGEVVHVDSFGNLITNISREQLATLCGERLPRIEVSGRVLAGLERSYSDVPRGHLVAVIGSIGFLEVAVRDGSAQRKLGVGRGDPIVVRVS
jgi:S-adenosylmethionine hydrolase